MMKMQIASTLHRLLSRHALKKLGFVVWGGGTKVGTEAVPFFMIVVWSSLCLFWGAGCSCAVNNVLEVGSETNLVEGQPT